MQNGSSHSNRSHIGSTLPPRCLVAGLESPGEALKALFRDLELPRARRVIERSERVVLVTCFEDVAAPILGHTHTPLDGHAICSLVVDFPGAVSGRGQRPIARICAPATV